MSHSSISSSSSRKAPGTPVNNYVSLRTKPNLKIETNHKYHPYEKPIQYKPPSINAHKHIYEPMKNYITQQYKTINANYKSKSSLTVLTEDIGEDGETVLRNKRTGRTVASKGKEKTWCSVTGKPPMLFGRALQTISVVLEMPPSTIVQVAGAEVQFNTAVQYAFLTGGADWLSVFDAYRIKLMQVTVRPTYTVGVVGMVKMPNVYTVIDYDDSAGVSGAVLQQYSNCTITGGETIVRTFHPHCEIDMGGAGSGNVESPWCDATSVNIPHFGFKAVVDPAAAGQTVFQEFSNFTRVLVEFRTTR